MRVFVQQTNGMILLWEYVCMDMLLVISDLSAHFCAAEV